MHHHAAARTRIYSYSPNTIHRKRSDPIMAEVIIVKNEEEAASRLRHKDYYRYAYAHKPARQGI